MITKYLDIVSILYLAVFLKIIAQCAYSAHTLNRKEENNFTHRRLLSSPGSDRELQEEGPLLTLTESCCTQGRFYEEKEFYDLNYPLESTLGDKLKGVYAFTLFDCSTVPTVSELLTGYRETVCRCDCAYAHGASGNEVCPPERNDVPCLCTYSEDDKLEIQDLHCDLPGSKRLGGPQMSSRQSDFQPNHKPMANRTDGQIRLGGADDVCATLHDTASKLICSEIEENGNAFYTLDKFEIYPPDICSLDCFYNHGSHSQIPYGECCNMEDGTKKCICLGQNAQL